MEGLDNPCGEFDILLSGKWQPDFLGRRAAVLDALEKR